MNENGSVDLSQGIVAQLLGKSGKVNGGSVSWNMEDHSLAYVDGALPIRNNVYVMADGTVSLSVTMADDILQFWHWKISFVMYVEESFIIIR